MEAILRALFDYQRFSPNPRLAALIAETEGRCALNVPLDDDLLNIHAAGDPSAKLPPEKRNGD